MAKIIAAQGATKPQSITILINEPPPIDDPPDPPNTPAATFAERRLVTYTGILGVGHGAGGTLTRLDIQFPLINSERKIQAYNSAVEFGRGIACCSLAVFKDKDDGISAVDEAHVNLHEVTLAPSSPAVKILAAVLTVKLASQDSEVMSISYHCHVIQRIRARPVLPALRAIDGATWDGSYAAIGPIVKLGDRTP